MAAVNMSNTKENYEQNYDWDDDTPSSNWDNLIELDDAKIIDIEQSDIRKKQKQIHQSKIYMSSKQVIIQEKKQVINKLQPTIEEQMTSLIGRISGLTDAELKIQCQEEYEYLESKLFERKHLEYTDLLASIKQSISSSISSSLSPSSYELFGRNFTYDNDLIRSIQKNNTILDAISLDNIIASMHIRKPTSLSDRRTLAEILKIIDAKLIVRDLHDNEVLTIGCGRIELQLYICMLCEYEVFSIDKHTITLIKN
jgi:hypothetical protein